MGKGKAAKSGAKNKAKPRRSSGRRSSAQAAEAPPSRPREPFDPARIVERYVADVLAGRLVAGRLLRLAVQRHVDDLAGAAARGFVFDEAKAREACLFFAGCLRFTKGELAAKPFVPLEQILAGDYEPGQVSNFIPAPFQCFILWNVFGWTHAATGFRRFTVFYFTVGRKGGKSEFLAGISLKLGLFDNPPEPGARVVIAATKKEQAFDLTFTQAVQMVEASPVLKKRCKVYRHSISTEDRPPQPFSSIKAIGSNSNTSDGFDLSAALLDELHAWQLKKHGKFYDKMTTASGARRQPLVGIGTTAGDDTSTIWLSKDALFVNILESAVIDKNHVADHVFAFIARIDEDRPCRCERDPACRDCGGKGVIAGDNIFDESAWPKANPNYPISPTPAALRELAALAKLDVTQQNAFRRYHCNVVTTSFEKALPPGLWSRCGTGLSDWAHADVISGGIDIGERDDLASVAYVARFTLPAVSAGKPAAEPGTKPAKEAAPRYRFECRSLSWSTNPNPHRDMSREPWKSWADRKLLILSASDAVDLEEMQNRIVADGKRLKVRAFRADPNNARQLLQNLEKAKFEIVEHRQAYWMFNEPIREFLRAVRAGLVAFDPATEPILTWAMANLIIRRNNRAEYMPDKARSPDKIDPAVALLMAFAEALYYRGPARGAARPYSGAPGTGMWS